jgi:hypothetical protein
MKRWPLFVLGVLLAVPAYADQRLSVTGFLDNHIRVFKNNSATDDDLTNNDDEPFGARTRGRITFSVAATEFSKAHVGLEFDQFWGDSRSNISGSGASPTRCVVSGVVAAPGQTPSCTTVNGGFDIGTDNFVRYTTSPPSSSCRRTTPSRKKTLTGALPPNSAKTTSWD